MKNAATPSHPGLAVGEHVGVLVPWRARTGRWRQGARWSVVCAVVDVAMLAAAVGAAAVGAPAAEVPLERPWWLITYPVIVLVIFRLRGLYAPRLRLQLLDGLRTIVASTAIAAMVLIALRTLLEDDPFAAQQVVRAWVFSTVYLSAGRAGLYWAQARARKRGEMLEPTLIIGAGQIGQQVARRILDDPAVGLRPVGFLDLDPLDVGDEGSGLPVLGASWDLDKVIDAQHVTHVIITFSTAPHSVLLGMARRCEERGVRVSLVPRLFENVNERASMEHLGGIPLLGMNPVDPRGWQFDIKYLCDRIVAAIALVLLSPVLIALAIGVKLSSPGPVLFGQQRVGIDGREFTLMKFRSMRMPDGGTPRGQDSVELPPDTAPGGVEEETDRRTALGIFMRRYSLDELPQLLNVLQGAMSLVGPRPERPAFVERFEKAVYRYSDRHRVKSGITGWAQIHGLRGRTSLADRIEWDNFYIENWSLWLDFKIILRTILVVAKGRAA